MFDLKKGFKILVTIQFCQSRYQNQKNAAFICHFLFYLFHKSSPSILDCEPALVVVVGVDGLEVAEPLLLRGEGGGVRDLVGHLGGGGGAGGQGGGGGGDGGGQLHALDLGLEPAPGLGAVARLAQLTVGVDVSVLSCDRRQS